MYQQSLFALPEDRIRRNSEAKSTKIKGKKLDKEGMPKQDFVAETNTEETFTRYRTPRQTVSEILVFHLWSIKIVTNTLAMATNNYRLFKTRIYYVTLMKWMK